MKLRKTSVMTAKLSNRETNQGPNANEKP